MADPGLFDCDRRIEPKSVEVGSTANVTADLLGRDCSAQAPEFDSSANAPEASTRPAYKVVRLV